MDTQQSYELEASISTSMRASWSLLTHDGFDIAGVTCTSRSVTPASTSSLAASSSPLVRSRTSSGIVTGPGVPPSP